MPTKTSKRIVFPALLFGAENEPNAGDILLRIPLMPDEFAEFLRIIDYDEPEYDTVAVQISAKAEKIKNLRIILSVYPLIAS